MNIMFIIQLYFLLIRLAYPSCFCLFSCVVFLCAMVIN